MRSPKNGQVRQRKPRQVRFQRGQSWAEAPRVRVAPLDESGEADGADAPPYRPGRAPQEAIEPGPAGLLNEEGLHPQREPHDRAARRQRVGRSRRAAGGRQGLRNVPAVRKESR